jgi:hypothetical protein
MLKHLRIPGIRRKERVNVTRIERIKLPLHHSFWISDPCH